MSIKNVEQSIKQEVITLSSSFDPGDRFIGDRNGYFFSLPDSSIHITEVFCYTGCIRMLYFALIHSRFVYAVGSRGGANRILIVGS